MISLKKEAIGKIGHECLEAAACRLLLGKTDRQRYGKRSGRRLKTVHEPRWMMVRKRTKGSVYGEVTDDVYGRGEGGDADHEA